MVMPMEGERFRELWREVKGKERERKGGRRRDLFGFEKSFNWSCTSHMTKDTSQFLMVLTNFVRKNLCNPGCIKSLHVKM